MCDGEITSHGTHQMEHYCWEVAGIVILHIRQLSYSLPLLAAPLNTSHYHLIHSKFLHVLHFTYLHSIISDKFYQVGINFSYSCGIELVDTFVVTGGYGDAGNRVQVYNMMGPVERLPNMAISRRGHGCAHYINSNYNIVSIIIIIQSKIIFALLFFRFIW